MSHAGTGPTRTILCCFSTGCFIGVEKLKFKLASTWNAYATGNGLTYYTMALTPQIFIRIINLKISLP